MNKMVDPSVAELHADPRSARHRPLHFKERNDRPIVRADEGDLARAVDLAWELPSASNVKPWLFRLAGIPTWVVRDDERRPIAVEVTEHRLRQLLARLGDWRREMKGGGLVAGEAVHGRRPVGAGDAQPRTAGAAGIVNTPVFGRNGSLVTKPGYHPDAELLYVPSPGFALPSISAEPRMRKLRLRAGSCATNCSATSRSWARLSVPTRWRCSCFTSCAT